MTPIRSLVTATAVAIGLVANGAAAQEIKVSHQWKANADGRDLATRVFIKEVNERDKNIKFRIYPAMSLGIKPVAQLDALQNGTLEMAVFPMSYAVGKAAEFSATILPGTIPNLDFAMKLKGSDFHKRLQELAHKHGIHIVTWWWTPGGFATKDREITGPKSVEGLKMRAADPTFESMLKAAGASVVSMPSTEIYPALQSGVLNGTLTSAETFVSMRLYEQTKHATVPGDYTLWMLMQPLVMSKQHWDKLTPQQQKIFEEAAAKADEYFLKNQRDSVGDMVNAYKKAGAKVHHMTKSEFDDWLALARQTSWKEFADRSPEAKSLLDALLQQAGKK
ncbi:MAG TPA: TRAP transporter substrate-binding protein DctP [Burkholderiaceae bacterium]|jgi:TRAP-type transport system periplasmic protein|nr:TRAP transporter substrate-binding protein DctP [Burkholderiaceae bacterium]